MQVPLVQNDVIEKWSRFLQDPHLFQGLQVRDLTEAPKLLVLKLSRSILKSSNRDVCCLIALFTEMSFTFNHLQLLIYSFRGFEKLYFSKFEASILLSIGFQYLL